MHFITEISKEVLRFEYKILENENTICFHLLFLVTNK